MNPGAGAKTLPDFGDWSDAKLIEGCLRRDERAWAALIAKYKNLIYSIPVRYGFSPDDSAEVFQLVCSKLVSELPRLRDPQALPAWLIKVAHSQCIGHRQKSDRYLLNEKTETPASEEQLPDRLLEQTEREQKIREALRSVSRRCRELVNKLFFEVPVRPYKIVAEELGLATGSIGFIRRRCLDQLRQLLD